MPVAHNRYTQTIKREVMTMIRPLSMREPLPDRRRSWTQEVVIGGMTFFLSVGEYEDGRPGEIWIDVAKEGTFVRGVMSILSRSVSISLQCGADLEAICHSLRGIDYPPDGLVTGSTSGVTECYSVTDWVASELEARYLVDEIETSTQLDRTDKIDEGNPLPVSPLKEKVAGFKYYPDTDIGPPKGTA